MGIVVPFVDMVVSMVASVTIIVLSDVARLALSSGLKRAWLVLSAMLSVCIALLFVHATYSWGHVPTAEDLVGVAIFFVGGGFIFAIAWLTRRTARDLLRAQDLAQHAYRDALTGLGNRRAFVEALNAATEQDCTTTDPLSVVVLDIDHFKMVNDGHGHAAGDEALRGVGRTIGSSLRTTDAAFRLGGEEFAVLMKNASRHDVVGWAESLRIAIADLVIVAGFDTHFSVTVSVGIAHFRPGEEGLAFLGRADTAMYAAKRGGRDCMKLAA